MQYDFKRKSICNIICKIKNKNTSYKFLFNFFIKIISFFYKNMHLHKNANESI